MSWWVAGATVVSSIIGAEGAKSAAGKQAKGAEKAMRQFEQTYEEQKAYIDPYYQAGTKVGLAGMTALADPQVQADFYRQYYQSPQFQQQAGAARNVQLASAEATGGLGATSTQNQLARIAPTLGLQALQQQQQTYGNLAQLGYGATGQLVQAGGIYGQNIADLYGQQAAAQAGAKTAGAGFLGDAIGAIGGAFG